jgi:Tol biopolymer transport system component
MSAITCLVAIGIGNAALAQTLTRASVNSVLVQGNSNSYGGKVSADGRYVVFASDSTNLVTGDGNNASDIFVHDMQTGGTSRVSLGFGGQQPNAGSYSPSISGDGHYIAFVSDATNLVPVDTNSKTDVFVRDQLAGSITRVSVSSLGEQGDGYSYQCAISSDGRYVAFTSTAYNLAQGGAFGYPSVYVRDLQMGTTVCASVNPSGQSGTGGSSYPSITADGHYVAFQSDSTDLVPGDTNAATDIFVRDMLLGVTVSPTVDPNWVIGNAASDGPSISADGRYVAFDSSATNFVLGDTNGLTDVFVKDVQTGTVVRASVDSAGSQGVGGSSYQAAISGDGRYVAFSSAATNLVANDSNGRTDVFLHNLQGGQTIVLSAAMTQGNLDSFEATISGDGRFIGFQSDATNLVPGDTNGVQDVFLYDSAALCGGQTLYCTAKVNSQGCAPQICAEGQPSISGPDNFYVTAHSELNNKTGIFLWSLAPNSVPLGGGLLCLHSPIVRTPGQNSGGTPGVNDCTGTYSFFFSHAYIAAHSLGSGSTVYGQYWSRDPFFAPPTNIGLTNGIQFTISP